MATATILPNGLTKNTGWATGALADIDEGIAAADGSLLSTSADGEGEQFTVDFASPGLTDADTITQCDVILRHQSGGASGNSLLDVEFLIGGAAQGVTQSTLNRTSLTNDTLNDVGWNTDWTQSQIDGVQVRVTAAQAGMPTAEQWDVDTLEILITYTPGASGRIMSSLAHGGGLAGEGGLAGSGGGLAA